MAELKETLKPATKALVYYQPHECYQVATFKDGLYA